MKTKGNESVYSSYSALKEYSNKDGFQMKKAKDFAKNKTKTESRDQSKIKGKVRYNKKDSIQNPDIHQNFYPPGSLMIELTFQEGEIQGKSIVVEAKSKIDMSIIHTLEFMFDDQKNIVNHLSPEQVKEHEEIAVYVYLRNSSGEDPYLIEQYDIVLKPDESIDGRPVTPSYNEKMKTEVCYEDIKCLLRIVVV